ncbi:flavin reductase family protein [Nocardioidaceae bacterium]|nr:flavin reductase family protein [Nocardioidaceae bacterium]
MRTDIDPESVPEAQGGSSYAVLTALVVPRPIAWVSTLGADGVGNLAPHSFFTVVSADPPVVAFTSVGEKDTLANVEATGEFVVNLAGEAQMEAVNATSASVDPHVDEAEEFGVRMEPSTVVAVPRVADSPAAIECRLHQTVRVGNSVVVMGRVVSFSVAEEALTTGLPSMDVLRPVSRLGGSEWGLPPRVVEVQRPR